MAIDFPTSPTTGQTVYLAGNAYTWDGTKWWTSTGKSAAVRQTFTAGAGQTTFTVTGGYFAGTIDVYLNGVKLVVGDDVTASDGSTVVLASGATAGDILEVVSFNSFSVGNMLPLTGGTLTGGLTGTTATFSGAVGTGALTATGNISSTGTVADSTGTFRPMILRTAAATTSGTAIDFSTIPSWVKSIQVMFAGVSTNGTTGVSVQIGTGGAPTTTGYNSTGNFTNQANGAGGSNSTTGFNISVGASATGAVSGIMTIVNISGNTWVSSHSAKALTTSACFGGGDVTLSGVLNFLRVTSTNGTDTFDAGSVNIMYEG